ncbi:hypothetical protein ACOXVJ_20320 [Pseudomonas knackmussii]|uniref:hypothetical protein n=1 Tax=Pseudomonas knackmussii TaxID=65741 RepID=UPI003BE3D214
MTQVAGRKVISVAGLEFTVKELTVAEIRALLMAVESEDDVDSLGDFLFEEVRLRDLQEMTTLTKDQIDQMLPSQLAEVMGECKAMNCHFFALGERLSKPRVKR